MHYRTGDPRSESSSLGSGTNTHQMESLGGRHARSLPAVPHLCKLYGISQLY